MEKWVYAESHWMMDFPKPTPGGQVGLFEAEVKFPTDEIAIKAAKTIFVPRIEQLEREIRHVPFERACEILRGKGMSDTEIAALLADLMIADCFNADGTIDLVRAVNWATRQRS